ncbi:MAG: bifunctional folylpolyglutamate synthase/dihydrofolate synthase, partial [Alphaproteobacteria bacterium]
RAIDLGLDRMRRVLARLGDPQRGLPPIIHVAGTNGKGSVIAFLRAILEATGRRVHVYTSPHLVDFRERIRLAGRLVEPEPLIAALDAVSAAGGRDGLTFFEATTAAAFLLFARTPADVLLLEVGLGGRLDATNVIADPRLCIITPIARDHETFLGGTLSEIAREKAGILKPGTTAVVGPQPEEAAAVIRRQAARLSVPLRLAGEDFTWGEESAAPAGGDDGGPGRWWFRGRTRRLLLPRPAALPGAHQLANAALALAAVEALPELEVPPQAMEAGIRWARWPGRLQRLDRSPLTRLLPPGSVLWVDGGHNEAAARAVAAVFARQDRPVELVLGMLANRPIAPFLGAFRRVARSVYGVPVPGHQAHSPAMIATAASRQGLAGLMAADVAGALTQIAARSGGRPVCVLVTGSLYLVGEVLAAAGYSPA